MKSKKDLDIQLLESEIAQQQQHFQLLELEVEQHRQQREWEPVYNKQEMLRRNLEVLISLKKLNLDIDMIHTLDNKILQIIANLNA